mmetsp:Transcript_73443/g.220703  ORF Transcript_73443/g.220703 Transcript_73443/m.220703 type:complete len:251 (-) Transcript_73443:276-1028(-)
MPSRRPLEMRAPARCRGPARYPLATRSLACATPSPPPRYRAVPLAPASLCGVSLRAAPRSQAGAREVQRLWRQGAPEHAAGAAVARRPRVDDDPKRGGRVPAVHRRQGPGRGLPVQPHLALSARGHAAQGARGVVGHGDAAHQQRRGGDQDGRVPRAPHDDGGGPARAGRAARRRRRRRAARPRAGAAAHARQRVGRLRRGAAFRRAVRQPGGPPVAAQRAVRALLARARRAAASGRARRRPAGRRAARV